MMINKKLILLTTLATAFSLSAFNIATANSADTKQKESQPVKKAGVHATAKSRNEDRFKPGSDLDAKPVHAHGDRVSSIHDLGHDPVTSTHYPKGQAEQMDDGRIHIKNNSLFMEVSFSHQSKETGELHSVSKSSQTGKPGPAKASAHRTYQSAYDYLNKDKKEYEFPGVHQHDKYQSMGSPGPTAPEAKARSHFKALSASMENSTFPSVTKAHERTKSIEMAIEHGIPIRWKDGVPYPISGGEGSNGGNASATKAHRVDYSHYVAAEIGEPIKIGGRVYYPPKHQNPGLNSVKKERK